MAARIFAPGYSRRKSPAHCSVKWFGTTNKLFWHKPRRLLSIAAAIISNVLPAPTQWASRVLSPYNWCATALSWCGLNSMSGVIPGNFKCEPSYSRGLVELNSLLYFPTKSCRRSASRNTQSLNASLIASCFCDAMVVSCLFSTRFSFPSSTMVSYTRLSFRFRESSRIV